MSLLSLKQVAKSLFIFAQNLKSGNFFQPSSLKKWGWKVRTIFASVAFLTIIGLSAFAIQQMTSANAPNSSTQKTNSAPKSSVSNSVLPFFVPSGSEYPATWSVTSSTTATGTTPSGITVSVATTGNIVILGTGSLTKTNGGVTPSYFPTTSTQAIEFQIPNNSVCTPAMGFTGCGTITYSFSKPIMTPVLYVGDIGKGAGGATWSTFNDAPFTVPSGMTFVLDAAGSQTSAPPMSIQNTNRSIGINTPTTVIGTAVGSGSCGKFGCGVYDVSGAGSISSLQFSIGYRGSTGTGQGNDNFTAMLGMTPTADLSVTKSSNGLWTVGQSGANYTLNVANSGLGASSGTITVRDALPTGITPNWTGTLNTGGFACTFSGQNVTCTTSTAIAVSGTATLTLPVNVTTATTPGTVTNYASIGGGGDAFNSGTAPTAGATCTDATHCASNATTVNSPNLTISKTHSPTTFVRGSTGTYSVTVGNSGTAATSGTITVVDTLPTGLTIPAGAVTEGGTNAADWSCTASGQTITCTSSVAIAASGSSVFSFNVNVASGAAASVTNNVSVSGGNEATANNTNNSATDATPTVLGTDLSITKTNGQTSYYQGQYMVYSIVVTNNGPNAANNAIFSDPSNSNFVVVSVTCGSASGGAACPTTANTTIALMQGAGIVIPTLPSGGSVTFTVAGALNSNVTGSFSNTANIAVPSGVTETNSSNNSATDTDFSSGSSTFTSCSNGAGYVNWAGSYASGTGSVPSTATLNPILPNLTFTTTGAGGSLALNTAEVVTAASGTDSGWTNLFGSPNGAEITRYHITTPGNITPIVQTITFATATTPDSWGFMIADQDVEQIKIEAYDASGGKYSDAVVSSWYRGVYDADSTNGINLPRWLGPTSPYTMGSGASGASLVPPSTPYVSQPASVVDTSRASIWFTPSSAVKTLVITYQNLDTATSTDRLYVASCMQPKPSVSGTLYLDSNLNVVFDGGETTLPANVSVILYNDANSNNKIDTGETVATTTTNASGAYTFSNVSPGTYKVRVDTADADIPTNYVWFSKDIWNKSVTVSTSNITGINFAFVTPDNISAVTQTCSAQGGTSGPNLFTLGNFGTVSSSTPGTSRGSGISQVPAGFTYANYNGSSFSPNDGFYTIVNKAVKEYGTDSGSSWSDQIPPWHGIGDRSGVANGAVGIFNATITPSVFYQETLTVTANTNYDFSGWIMNLNTLTYQTLAGTRLKPNLVFEMQRVGIDSSFITVASTGDIAENDRPTWQQYGTVINSSSATQIIFRIRNNANGGAGNDLALDDLNLSSCQLNADAAISKTGTASANIGQAVSYTIDVTNNGPANLIGGTITDNVPANITGVTWTCTATGTATCGTASGSGNNISLTGNINSGSGNKLTIAVSGTASTAGNITNTATVAVPTNTTDSNSANNTSSQATSIAVPDLTITKSHTGNFTRGGTGTYTMTVNNIGTGASSGTITVSDTLPTGLSVANGALTLGGTNSANWSCSAASNVITCTSSTAIAASGSSVFTFNVNVASNAQTSVTNTATVSGGGQTNTTNDSSSDVTSIPQTSFGTCDSRMFLSQGPDSTTNTTLYNISTSTNPFTYPAIGQGSEVYNAIAFNPADYYIYAIKGYNNLGNELLRIGADGSTINLGTVTGLPTQFYNNGEIGSNGVFYVRPANANNQLYAIDLSTKTATLINLSTTVNSVDLVWISGKLYTVTNNVGQLISIDPATGVVTNIGSPTASTGNYGAMFGAPNGLFGNANDGSGLYQFDLVTGARTLISSSPGASLNDGAHCVNANITFPADIAVTKTDGQTTYSAGSNVVYTITATNNGPFGAQNATVSDPLPSGITTASWTCAGTGGGVCTASGTGAINDTTVDLPNGATVTYTMTMTVPSGFTGNLVNTATATVGSSNTDPTPGNNSASDTDTAGLPNVGLVKSCPSPANCTTASQLPGTDVTYNIAFTNSGGIGAQNMVIVDGIPTNTDYKLGTATANVGTTGLTFAIEYSSDYDALNPSLATWFYTPVSTGGGASAGYDRNVKAIRWRVTSGILSNVSPNNTGNVGFVVKIR